MTTTTHTVALPGCTPEPLMNYLKALGVLRLVAEQADPSARGFWRGDTFCLQTTLNENALCEFFLERYQPTPLVGPWGARSGFFDAASEKSGREALQAIERSGLSRLEEFAAAIRGVRAVLESLGLTEKADSPEAKRQLMMQCRAMLPDGVLDWLDATYVLLDEDTKYPPLLGTGGNEGSGSYMSGFSQQVVAVLVDRQWDYALRPALLGECGDRLATSQTPGHFSPSAAGGANAGSSSEGGLTTNPWDYLLALEGSLMFAAACVKRLEQQQPGSLSYPFCVRQAGVGYGSAASGDEGLSRAEMWLPLWSRPATVAELGALFSEGRATLGSRRARNGVDFARAISSLGVDRGISEFERYAFQQRNGLSYFAIPLGRFHVQPQPQIELLAEIDDWLDRFRGAASSDTAPASAGRALRRLEQSILDLCRQRSPVRLQDVLIALGECEQVLAMSSKWRSGEGKRPAIRPVPLLSHKWLLEAGEGTGSSAGEGTGSSTEFRLAVSLAGLFTRGIGSLRQHIEPVAIGKDRATGNPLVFFVDESSAAASVVWSGADLERNLAAVVTRRIVEAVRLGAADDGVLTFPDRAACAASLGDVAAFLNHNTDDRRLAELLRGLTLLDWSHDETKQVARRIGRGEREPVPDATFSLLKLCHTHLAVPHGSFECQVKLDPRIARLLSAGRVADAIQLAAQRLRGSGLPPAFTLAGRGSVSGQRLLASLLFPISDFPKGRSDIDRLAHRVLQRTSDSDVTDSVTSEDRDVEVTA